MTKEDFTRDFSEILCIDPRQLTPDSDLTEIPEWDSVAYLSAMVLIDEKLAIAIRPDALSNAKTFGDILAAVQSALEN